MTSAPPGAGVPPRKAASIALLLPCALFTGLLAGMLIGARLVPAGAGLAGGAEVLFYGIVGAILGAILTLILARRLGPQPLRRVALVCLALAVVALAVLAWQIVEKKNEIDERSRIAGG